MGKWTELILNNFVKGLHTNCAYSDVKYNEASNLQNVELYPHGVISVRNGYTSKHETALPTAANWLEQFFTPEGTDFLLAFTPYKSGTTSCAQCWVWRPATKTWEEHSPASSGDWSGERTDLIMTETYEGLIFACNGLNCSLAWDGTLVSNFEKVAVTSTAGFVHKNGYMVPAKIMKGFKGYLFLAGTEEGGDWKDSRIRWCDPGDYTSWPAENYVDLDADDGDYITGMELLGDELIVFKERKIYSVVYLGGQYDFGQELRIDGRGCVAPLSLTSTYNDLVFLAEDGIYAFTGRDIEELSFNIKDQILSIDPTTRYEVQSAPLEEKDQLFFTVPYAPLENDEEPHNKIFVYDIDKEAWTIHNMKFSALGFYYNVSDMVLADLPLTWNSYDFAFDDRVVLDATSRMIACDWDGYVSDIDDAVAGYSDAATASAAGSAIESYYETGWLVMADEYGRGGPLVDKEVKRITFLLESQGIVASILNVSLYTDWDEDTPTSTFSLTMGGTGYPQSGTLLEKRLDFRCTARSFKLRWGTDGVNKPWSVHEVRFEFKYKGTHLRG